MPDRPPTVVLVHVLLVGHSWGGSIITEAGNNPEVSGLGYMAAAAPDFGQSFNEWWAALLHATQVPFAQGSNNEKITTAA